MSTAQPQTVPSATQQLLDAYEEEHATTMRVLRAYPADKLELRPHARSRTARELAWLFAAEQPWAIQALTTGLDWSAAPPQPAIPDSLDAIIGAVHQGHEQLMETIRSLPEERLSETVQFPVAPGTIGEITKQRFLWLLLCDQIHHRGQLSVYLRLADARVPSIYGPTADEPWH